MAYEKVTLDVFKSKLKSGKYETLTGARRAIGKSTAMSQKDGDAARAAADRHFGAPKKAAKPAGKTAKKASKKG